MKSHYLLPLILISSLSYATPSALQNKDVVISPLSLQKEKRGDGKITGESSDTAFCINKNEKWISRFYLSGNQNPDSFRVTSIQIQDTPFTCLQNEAIPIN